LQSCIRGEEVVRHTQASRPQFSYGRNMRELDLPKSFSSK